MSRVDAYADALRDIPRPGAGCHPYLLSVANYGVRAGLSPEQIFDDVRESIPTGNRRPKDREITEAINKALAGNGSASYTPRPRPKPVVQDGKAALRSIIRQGKYSDDADLWEASPIRLYDEPQQDTILFLSTLFEPDDLIWIGERYDEGIMGETIRPTRDWIEHFRSGGGTAPHIIVNPLDGTPRKTKSGDKDTLRGDTNVIVFRYCLVEFDNLSREEQIRFWSAAKLPIIALIDTGGKSIHAWLDVQKLTNVLSADQWNTEIKERLYDRILKPLGVDGACSNAARLSRLPGHFREEKGAFQRLLWLAPSGRSI